MAVSEQYSQRAKKPTKKKKSPNARRHASSAFPRLLSLPSAACSGGIPAPPGATTACVPPRSSGGSAARTPSPALAAYRPPSLPPHLARSPPDLPPPPPAPISLAPRLPVTHPCAGRAPTELRGWRRRDAMPCRAAQRRGRGHPLGVSGPHGRERDAIHAERRARETRGAEVPAITRLAEVDRLRGETKRERVRGSIGAQRAADAAAGGDNRRHETQADATRTSSAISRSS